jgi:hypothetical protein
VDGADLGVLLSAWGPAGPESARADINGNGIVDGADLGVLLANWGACGEAPPWATVVQWQPDPAVVTNPVLRDAISATGLPWRVKDTATQIEMLLIPPGEFTMGCSASAQHGCAVDEHPIHQVTLTNALYLGRYEVTQAQWQATMGSNPSNFSGFADSDRRPVEQVGTSFRDSSVRPGCVCPRKLSGSTHAVEARRRRSMAGTPILEVPTRTVKLGPLLGTVRTQGARPIRLAQRQQTDTDFTI